MIRLYQYPPLAVRVSELMFGAEPPINPPAKMQKDMLKAITTQAYLDVKTLPPEFRSFKTLARRFLANLNKRSPSVLVLRLVFRYMKALPYPDDRGLKSDESVMICHPSTLRL